MAADTISVPTSAFPAEVSDLELSLAQLSEDMLSDGDKMKQELKKSITLFNASLEKAVTSVQRSLHTLNKKIEQMTSACTDRCVEHAASSVVSAFPAPVKRKNTTQKAATNNKKTKII